MEREAESQGLQTGKGMFTNVQIKLVCNDDTIDHQN